MFSFAYEENFSWIGSRKIEGTNIGVGDIRRREDEKWTGRKRRIREIELGDGRKGRIRVRAKEGERR